MRGLTVGSPVVVTAGALAGLHATLPRGATVDACIHGLPAMAACIHGLPAVTT